jgi:hypothetical protein
LKAEVTRLSSQSTTVHVAETDCSVPQVRQRIHNELSMAVSMKRATDVGAFQQQEVSAAES